MVYVIFEDDVDLYFARSRVLERMSLVGKTLPTGVVPTLGPDATGVGHVFWYTVESPTHSLRELRTFQGWFIRYQLNAVPGVAEVASVGRHVQQYQIDVDPNRLRVYNLPLGAVVSAVRETNLNVGGNVLESNGAWLIVREGWPDRISRRCETDRRGRIERRAGLRGTGGQCPDRQRVQSRIARQRDRRSNVGDRQVVYLPVPDAPAGFIEREVRVGRSSGDIVEVLSGVAAGDSVVSTGSVFVRAEAERLGLRGSPPQANVQTAKVVVSEKGFEPAKVTLRAGVPARLSFVRTTDNTCGTEVVFPSLNIKRALPLNQPVEIEFTPAKAGEFAFACGMNMLQGTVVVQ
jgi:hypothetical protein